MTLKKILFSSLTALTLFLGFGCNRNPSLEISLPEKFEGCNVEIINFLDSTSIASATVKDGKVIISKSDTTPVFTAVNIEGRTRAFYILENGKALLNDSISIATGTPLNDEFSALMIRLDSIENLDDTQIYADFAREEYKKYKDSPIGDYLGIELMKYGTLQDVETIMEASPKFEASNKAQYYKKLAIIRDATAPGKKFTDLGGESENGKPAMLSSYVNDKGFTLIDFWASWCPYCIKEIPELTALKEKWGNEIVKIVGVAVRDVPEDTKAMVNKHNISWPVIYNTQRVPYDIYGFTGIPHHILLDANGIIISRGESVNKIDSIIEKKLIRATM